MHRALLPLLLLTAACAGGPPPEKAFALEVEGGAVWQSRNDAAVPGDTGTRFALDDITDAGPFAAARAYLTWRPAARHELRALAAPFSASGTADLEAPVDFAGQRFFAGVPTSADYRFDSYRLTWRYAIHPGETFRWWLGGTLKVRDAEIELRQGMLTARKRDTGLVPLLHVAGDWRFADRWRLALDVDGAWAPQGRAVDASLKVGFELGDGLELGFGYRTVEGGADNDEVYTFAWLHQAVVSLSYEF